MIFDNPAALRNADVIYEVLHTALKERFEARLVSVETPLQVLELASGPGTHVERFARRLPAVRWQPSEVDPELRASIDARVEQERLANVASALALDVCGAWPAGPFDAVMAVNLLHIAPWEVAQALMAQTAEVLSEGGLLMIYGPFREQGAHVSQGNVDFDAQLRARDARFGIRDLEAVVELGEAHGLRLARLLEMPANNRTLFLASE